MPAVMAFLREVLRHHKLKILSVFVFAFAFALLIFPYNDLGNLLTTKVYEGSGQSIYLAADNLDLSLFPFPGVQAEGVSVEAGVRGPQFAPLKLTQLKIRPLLSAILAFHFGLAFSGEGLFGGNVSLAAATANSVFSGNPGAIELKSLELEDIALAAILDYFAKMSAAPLELKIAGKLSAESPGMTFDPTAKEPIKGKLDVSVDGLTLPTQIPLQGFGSLEIPQIKMQKAEFQTDWSGGKMKIVKGTFGNDKDPLSGRLLGEIEMRAMPNGGISPGSYNICLELNFTQNFYNDLNKKIPVLEGFKPVTETFRQQGGAGVRYGMLYSGFDLTQMLASAPRPGNCDRMAGTK